MILWLCYLRKPLSSRSQLTSSITFKGLYISYHAITTCCHTTRYHHSIFRAKRYTACGRRSKLRSTSGSTILEPIYNRTRYFPNLFERRSKSRASRLHDPLLPWISRASLYKPRLCASRFPHRTYSIDSTSKFLLIDSIHFQPPLPKGPTPNMKVNLLTLTSVSSILAAPIIVSSRCHSKIRKFWQSQEKTPFSSRIDYINLEPEYGGAIQNTIADALAILGKQGIAQRSTSCYQISDSILIILGIEHESVDLVRFRSPSLQISHTLMGCNVRRILPRRR